MPRAAPDATGEWATSAPASSGPAEHISLERGRVSAPATRGSPPGARHDHPALRDRFTDPLTLLKIPDADLCGGRIDYILVTGYVPTSYKQDCTANSPSDHPMVLAVIEAN
jgi:hypothetical protein